MHPVMQYPEIALPVQVPDSAAGKIRGARLTKPLYRQTAENIVLAELRRVGERACLEIAINLTAGPRLIVEQRDLDSLGRGGLCRGHARRARADYYQRIMGFHASASGTAEASWRHTRMPALISTWQARWLTRPSISTRHS